jgi:hypothetical protein
VALPAAASPPEADSLPASAILRPRLSTVRPFAPVTRPSRKTIVSPLASAVAAVAPKPPIRPTMMPRALASASLLDRARTDRVSPADRMASSPTKTPTSAFDSANAVVTLTASTAPPGAKVSALAP